MKAHVNQVKMTGVKMTGVKMTRLKTTILIPIDEIKNQKY